MKLLCIIGSNNINSETNIIMNKIFYRVNKHDRNIEISYVKLSEENLTICKGCGLCFKIGKCILDKSDGMTLIRKKIDQCDMMIWASPVYMAMVTGVMKNFIDRLSFYAHLLQLSGKLGAVYSIMRSSGGVETCDYMKTVQSSLGCKTIIEQPISILNINKENIDFLAKEFMKAVALNYDLSTPLLEQHFKMIKKTFVDDYNSLNSFENEYWNNPKNKYCESFQQYAQIKILSRKEYKNE